MVPPASNPTRPPRTVAAEIAAVLVNAGHVAYFAGGCVRDRLRGETPIDYDVATDATPAAIRRIFPRAMGVGEAFGVMLIRRHGCSVEVATFRSDGRYSDRRRPDDVHFGTPEADALRRDFTINGLFEDPSNGAIIDFVGGEEDLRRGILRAIGDPRARLGEDPLRALRAVRFAARFGMVIDPATAEAVREAAALEGVSRERVGQELRRMAGHPSAGGALALLQELQLDRAVLGEPSCTAPLPRVRATGGRAAIPGVLAAWFLDRVDLSEGDGAPTPEAIRRRLARWSERLVLSNAERDELAAILLRVGPPIGLFGWRAEPWSTLRVAHRKRLASLAATRTALFLLAAVDAPAASAIRCDIEQLDQEFGGISPVPMVSGDDLIAAGLVPGPVFAEVLRETYDAQLEGAIRSPELGLRFAMERARVRALGGTGEEGNRRRGLASD